MELGALTHGPRLGHSDGPRRNRTFVPASADRARPMRLPLVAFGVAQVRWAQRASHQHRAARVVHQLAEEETAKFLLLLDPVRCPRGGDSFERRLARFNDHLAKGIYAEYAGIRPAAFRQAIEFIDAHRRDCYLDGPNEVNWILCNSILGTRGEHLYVDYVETHEGHRGSRPSGSRAFPQRCIRRRRSEFLGY
jgi:hypothetical protein